MAESKTVKILDTIVIFTKDQSIEDGMVLVDIDGNISLMTVVELNDLFLKISEMNIKMIKYRMNSHTEKIVQKMGKDNGKEVSRLRKELELQKEEARVKVVEVKAKFSAEVKKIDDLVANMAAFNLEIMEELEEEGIKLRGLSKKKTKPEDFQKFKAKFNDLNRRIQKKQDDLLALFESYAKNIQEILDKVHSDQLYFVKSMDPSVEAVLITDKFVSELEKEMEKRGTKLNHESNEIITNLDLLADLINQKFKSSVVLTEKRARASSVESEGSSVESALKKGPLLKLVKESQKVTPPSLPRHPELKKKARKAEAEAEAEVELVLEPEKAKDVHRFFVTHISILRAILKPRLEPRFEGRFEGRLEPRLEPRLEARLDPRLEARLEERLSELAGMGGAGAEVATSPDVEAVLKQVIFFRDEVVDQPFVVKVREDLDKAARLLTSVSQKVERCSVEAAAGGVGCPEADLSAKTMKLLEESRVKWIEAEASALGTLIAQKQSDHEIALAEERVGWVAQKYKVANYAEFIEHIRSQATAVGLIVKNGIPKDPSRDPRPAIYIEARAGTPLHLTLSPDVLSSGKFHMTHNNLPKESKRFYFSIKYDPGHKRPYIVADGSSARIEIDQIAKRFIDELTSQGLPTKEISKEVGQLLEFLMSNMDTQSTKRRGGYYEKYMKYKLKYLRLKAENILI